jgi:DNA-binding XRE family transcriptional regulator
MLLTPWKAPSASGCGCCASPATRRWTTLPTASGVSRAMISRIERGEASPTAQLLSRLCAALDLTLSAFFAFSRRGG